MLGPAGLGRQDHMRGINSYVAKRALAHDRKNKPSWCVYMGVKRATGVNHHRDIAGVGSFDLYVDKMPARYGARRRRGLSPSGY